MGGGDGKKQVDCESSDNDVLKLELTSEFKQIPCNATNLKCSMLAKVTAYPQSNEDKRAPVTICAAIDRSASMKENLPLLKDTMQFMITQLRSEDRLCIVTFDHEVIVNLPVTNMDPAGKSSAEKAVKNINERGHTNLSGGLLGALQALYRIPADQASLVESVVLFSDGKANYGITDPKSLAKATRSILDQIKRQACVFTIGFGAEHDPDMLHAIANAGGGIFYYIENKDNIPDSFCDCLGGLLSVAAQNVVLTFLSPQNITIRPPLSVFPTKPFGNGYQVTIPDIYNDEEKCVPIEVVFSFPRTNDKAVCGLKCSLEYFDVVQCKSTKVEQSIEMELSKEEASVPVLSSYISDIRMQILRCEIVKSLVKATELADKGEISEAREILNHCKTLILSNPSSTVLTRHLLESIQESLAGLEDKQVYIKHGKPTMMQYLHSHGQQRSSSNPSKHGFDCEHGNVGATPGPFVAMWKTKEFKPNPYLNNRKKAMKVKFSDYRTE